MDEHLGSYRRVEFNNDGVLYTTEDGSFNQVPAGNDPEQTVGIEGDHVYVDQVSGGLPAYLRTETDGHACNPFLPLREGATIARAFSRLTFRAGWYGRTLCPGYQTGRVVLFVSTGRLYRPPEKHYGLRRGFYADVLPLSTTAESLGALIRTKMQIPDGVPSIGRGAGTLWIKNLEAAGGITVYLGTGRGLGEKGAHGDGWPLAPGEEKQLQIDDVIADAYPSQHPSPYASECLTLWAASGTPDVAVMLTSGEFDALSGENPTDGLGGSLR